VALRLKYKTMFTEVYIIYTLIINSQMFEIIVDLQLFIMLTVVQCVFNLIDLEPVYDIAPHRGNFQGYDFLNPHGSGHSLVKVCKVLLGL